MARYSRERRHCGRGRGKRRGRRRCRQQPYKKTGEHELAATVIAQCFQELELPAKVDAPQQVGQSDATQPGCAGDAY
jgi:hypothetical protein